MIRSMTLSPNCNSFFLSFAITALTRYIYIDVYTADILIFRLGFTCSYFARFPLLEISLLQAESQKLNLMKPEVLTFTLCL